MFSWPKTIKYLLVIASLLALFLVYNPGLKKSELQVTFFDVGQGDAAMIKTRQATVLIDGGPDQAILSRLGEMLPFGDQTIDLVILTHPHADHVTGLNYVLEKYPVQRVWLTGVVHTSSVYLNFLQLIKDKNIASEAVSEGKQADLGDGIKLTVLYPSTDLTAQKVADLNDTSLVLKLTAGEQSFLFVGDIGTSVEARLVAADAASLKSDVLKIGHQGSDTSSSEEFLKMVQPRFAVISVGENSYGHPSLRILKRLERLGIYALRTDEQGSIVFIVKDGKLVLDN